MQHHRSTLDIISFMDVHLGRIFVHLFLHVGVAIRFFPRRHYNLDSHLPVWCFFLYWHVLETAYMFFEQRWCFGDVSHSYFQTLLEDKLYYWLLSTWFDYFGDWKSSGVQLLKIILHDTSESIFQLFRLANCWKLHCSETSILVSTCFYGLIYLHVLGLLMVARQIYLW